MRRFIYIATIFFATITLAACTQGIDVEQQVGVGGDGLVKISFKTTIDGFEAVDVRAVDPDGIDIQNLTLFCFNEYGLFISTVRATITPDSSTSGVFEATIPEETGIIHFIANQNPNLYNENDFRGKSEASVIAAMEGASGVMIYWARFERDMTAGAPSINAQIAALPNGIELLRNQAKITIANWNNDYLNVIGFVTTNRQAFGTVAPFHPEEGFVWPGSEPFVTLPQNTSLMSDITDIDTKAEDYLFESENDDQAPISVIIKGSVPGSSEQLYYRIVLIDENGDRIKIRRNCSYQINIVGELTYGKPTFEEALVAPASNNVWISVASWVNEIEDDNYTLSVEKTYVVLNDSEAGKLLTLNYKVTAKSGSTLSDADISWVGENNVANYTFVDQTFDSAGNGSVTLQLLPMTDPTRQSGTLLVKKGKLQRTIDIIVIKTQYFTPSWVGTQIFGGATGEFVTLKFNIPETCPEELYPFNVLISVNSLDVRSSSGMNLPVIRKGEEGYGKEENSIGYKYVYTVTKPGVQRLYFQTILEHGANDNQDIIIEADYFETLVKQFTFTDHQYAITIEGLEVYNVNSGSNPDDDFPDDEVVLYRLVPQKRNAPVTFDMQMIDKATGSAINAGAADEFMVYSKTLDFYTEGHDDHGAIFYSISEDYWSHSTNGRVFMFMLKEPTKVEPNVGQYTIHLKTNSAVSEDVVRVASNNTQSNSAIPGASNTYSGNTYRSVIFELANYRPFHFAAQINGQGEYERYQVEESVSHIEWSYEPNQNIDISFEVTSFRGSDNKSVDPFGESFEIYIDAPMLELDPTRFAEFNIDASKVRKLDDGRFAYTVAADREAERAFGYGTVLNADEMGNVDQTGERKTIPFKTNTVTSAGTITISSDKEKVVFYDKQFRVTNKLISGRLTYNDGTTSRAIPQYGFVAFARTSDGVRIGSINIGENGNYTLNLRKEYAFNWYTDQIEMYYTDPTDSKVVYQATITSLNDLFHNPNVELSL
ncbi:MAG: hypothetical protein IJB23_05180 [Alistipes sp.]|nr:hypothetical protein [Alistipes sp.]